MKTFITSLMYVDFDMHLFRVMNKDGFSNRNIFMYNLSRSPHENFPKFWGVCGPHCVWRFPPTLEFVFCPSFSCPAYWDHEECCLLGGKSKYWVALTEVIVSPCLDTLVTGAFWTCRAFHGFINVWIALYLVA